MPDEHRIGDEVAILATPETEEQGLAGRSGVVAGISAEDGGPAISYAVMVDGLDRVWMVDPVALRGRS